MNLDQQLAALLANLGVVFEEPGESEQSRATVQPREPRARFEFGTRPSAHDTDMLHHGSGTGARARDPQDAAEHETGAEAYDGSVEAMADISLFQTSREHYGVFYRLDLTGGVPHLRIFMPEELGALKMRCYLVRAAIGTPLHEWFLSTRLHDGSQAYEDARDSAQQHLLFAAGELMKRLFWTGDLDQMTFPTEVDVLRIA